MEGTFNEMLCINYGLNYDTRPHSGFPNIISSLDLDIKSEIFEIYNEEYL